LHFQHHPRRRKSRFIREQRVRQLPRSSGFPLRLLYQEYSARIEAALHEAGFDDVRPSAANVFPFVPPEGISVSELAQFARIRKEAMAQAVAQLERAGYVTRRLNPRNGRSQLVYLTKRGASVPPITHAAAKRVEEDWEKLIGPDKLESLCALLMRLLEATG
jgi:DNA-binding MarR family transcriptional regulator